MNNLHDIKNDSSREGLHNKLERACDVLDDVCDTDARDAVIEAGKAVMAQKGMLEIIDSQRQTFNALMKKYEHVFQHNEDAKQLLKEAQHTLHKCNGVFVPGNDRANKYIADLCRMIEDFLDGQSDSESKNMLRKARDAASERALKYAAKAGELELENAALKIRLEQEGIDYE